jgi:hypothetical protein
MQLYVEWHRWAIFVTSILILFIAISPHNIEQVFLAMITWLVGFFLLWVLLLQSSKIKTSSPKYFISFAKQHLLNFETFA